MTEWKDEDEFKTTYGTLKRSLSEAADAERERIVALLQEHGRTLVFGDDKRLMANVIRVIRGEFD